MHKLQLDLNAWLHLTVGKKPKCVYAVGFQEKLLVPAVLEASIVVIPACVLAKK